MCYKWGLPFYSLPKNKVLCQSSFQVDFQATSKLFESSCHHLCWRGSKKSGSCHLLRPLESPWISLPTASPQRLSKYFIVFKKMPKFQHCATSYSLPFDAYTCPLAQYYCFALAGPGRISRCRIRWCVTRLRGGLVSTYRFHKYIILGRRYS